MTAQIVSPASPSGDTLSGDALSTGAPAPVSPVLRTPPAAPAEAAAYFAARLAFHTDAADVHAALTGGGDPGFVLVDVRSTEAWDQGHIADALHLPTADIPQHAAKVLDPAVPVVVHCWGPGCDGATRAAVALAERGYRVKEMLGGIEYWIREGHAVRTAQGREQHAPDPLTAPAGDGGCGC